MYNVKATDIFKKNIKKLSKKFRRIKKDFLPLLEDLEAGQFIGNPISGFDNEVYKVRVPSSDQQKGKSGGFRLIYYVVIDDKEIVLLTMYAKAKRSNIRNNEIQEILDQL